MSLLCGIVDTHRSLSEVEYRYALSEVSRHKERDDASRAFIAESEAPKPP